MVGRWGSSGAAVLVLLKGGGGLRVFALPSASVYQ
jgi:hypothetical protein